MHSTIAAFRRIQSHSVALRRVAPGWVEISLEKFHPIPIAPWHVDQGRDELRLRMLLSARAGRRLDTVGALPCAVPTAMRRPYVAI
jgi:hypothetical protein